MDSDIPAGDEKIDNLFLQCLGNPMPESTFYLPSLGLGTLPLYTMEDSGMGPGFWLISPVSMILPFKNVFFPAVILQNACLLSLFRYPSPSLLRPNSKRKNGSLEGTFSAQKVTFQCSYFLLKFGFWSWKLANYIVVLFMTYCLQQYSDLHTHKK